MRILGLDLESTWTDPVNAKLARPTEVGAVLFDTETRRPLEIYSSLIYDKDYPPSPKELVALTGITDEMMAKHGKPGRDVFLQLHDLMRQADYMLAHNGMEFDRVIYLEECDRLGLKAIDIPWIDTKTDVPFPPCIKTLKLSYLASEHGFVNPFSHRAIFDVLTMIKIADHYDWNEIINLSKQPNVRVIASVSFQDKELAKARGYYWDGENKRWTKVMKEQKAQDEKNQAPFPVQLIHTPTNN